MRPHDEKQPHQEVEDCYMWKKHAGTWELPMNELIEMVEKHSTLITINYGTYFFILEYFIQSL